MTPPATQVRYAIAATARSACGIGVIDHPHPGQKAVFLGISIPQCGHFAAADTAFDGLDNSASISLLSALFANAVDLKRVTCRSVTVFAAYFALDLSHLLREEFNRSAAFRADHMVMAPPVVLVLVAGNAVVKGDFACQSATRQQLQSPVNRGDADPRVVFLDQSMELINREMFPRLKKCSQDRAALFRLLQADATKMLQKNIFRLADVLLRDIRLIVNSLLQHCVRRGPKCQFAPWLAIMILGEREFRQTPP